MRSARARADCDACERAALYQCAVPNTQSLSPVPRAVNDQNSAAADRAQSDHRERNARLQRIPRPCAYREQHLLPPRAHQYHSSEIAVTCDRATRTRAVEDQPHHRSSLANGVPGVPIAFILRLLGHDVLATPSRTALPEHAAPAGIVPRDRRPRSAHRVSVRAITSQHLLCHSCVAIARLQPARARELVSPSSSAARALRAVPTRFASAVAFFARPYRAAALHQLTSISSS